MHRVSSKYLVGLAILYVFAGGMIGIYGTTEYLLARGLVAPRQEIIVTIVNDYVFPTVQPTSPAQTTTPEPAQGPIQAPPEIIETPQPTPEVWGSLDLTSGANTYMIFYTDETTYATGEFRPYTYRPGIFESEFFDPDQGGAVSWTDNQARIVLWAHSGPNHTMTPVQRFLELDERGFIVNGSLAEERMAQELLGRGVQFVQPNTVFDTFISAWARIPPDLVPAINTHVDDLPEILRMMYPNQGWEGFNRDTLIIFFCGRQLTGDPKDPTRPYWQQTRYVIGLLPYNANQSYGPLANLGGDNAR